MGLKNKILMTAVKTLIVSKAASYISEKVTDYAVKKAEEKAKDKIKTGVNILKDGIDKTTPEIVQAVNSLKEMLKKGVSKINPEVEKPVNTEVKPKFTTVQNKEETEKTVKPEVAPVKPEVKEEVKPHEAVMVFQGMKITAETNSIDLLQLILSNSHYNDEYGDGGIMRFIVKENAVENKDLVVGNADKWLEIIEKSRLLSKTGLTESLKHHSIASDVQKYFGENISKAYIDHYLTKTELKTNVDKVKKLDDESVEVVKKKTRVAKTTVKEEPAVVSETPKKVVRKTSAKKEVAPVVEVKTPVAKKSLPKNTVSRVVKKEIDKEVTALKDSLKKPKKVSETTSNVKPKK